MRSQKYPNSLLFKISGNEFKKPSWLLGTMHMICAKDFLIKKKVLHALRKCDRYFMEVDLGNSAEISQMQEQGETMEGLGADLSVREREELDKILTIQFGVPAEEAAQLPPIALINKLTIDAIGCEEIVMAESELLAIAQEAGITTGGLETAEEQTNIARKVFTGKEMLLQLKSYSDYKDLFGKMKTAYQAENLLELAMFVNDKRFMSRSAYNTLVISRNKRWSKKIPKLMDEESVFIAVGAGHLPGEGGVINLLRLQGLSVNPVYR